MRTYTIQVIATALAAFGLSSSIASPHHVSNFKRLPSIHARDASTVMSGGTNNEGEAHGNIDAPNGATFTSVNVGTGGEEIAAYWTANPANEQATQAFIMIHGKLRDGDAYWTTMNDALQSAIQDNVSGVDKNAIVVAPQFFSTIFNSGQYSKNELAWADVNAWQAGDIATNPSGTKLTSFDALDALVDEFTNTQKYPAMKNVTVVGHGGGGQLNQRYAMVAKDAPSGIHIRYIHGDPSSCAYFTTDRPTSVTSGDTIPSVSSCQYYNTWRYGFDNFTGTAAGLLSPQDYFRQYITRDVISIVGYQDVDASGDQYCMANMQGGSKRRDRNLSWWQYVNTLARTNEDLEGFPATFDTLPDWSNISNHWIQLQLIVVENADHDASLVFSSDEGRASLFSSGKMPTGWRPNGWTIAAPLRLNANSTTTSSSSVATRSAKPASANSTTNGSSASISAAAPIAISCLLSLLINCILYLN